MNRISKTIFAVCLCLCPAAWSFAVSLRVEKPLQEFQQTHSQPLAMHIHMVHLRPFDLREGKAIATFDFHNAGNKPITITNIKPSCGCIQVRMHNQGKQILQNEKGKFFLEVDTAGESAGMHEYNVRIDYQQQGDDETVLSESVLYRVEVPRKKVTVRPRALIFYQLSQGKTTQTIQLVDFRPASRFKITNLQIESEFLTAAKTVTGNDKYGHHQLSIDVTVQEEVPPGKHTGKVIIDTDDDEFPQLRIPVLIYGAAAPNND